MPPSGYEKKQIRYITRFLHSCYDSLLMEAEELKLSLGNALDREIRNIDFAFSVNAYSSTAGIVMLLTKDFYNKLKNLIITDNFNDDISSVLNEIEIQLLEIDIESLIEQSS